MTTWMKVDIKAREGEASMGRLGFIKTLRGGMTAALIGGVALLLTLSYYVGLWGWVIGKLPETVGGPSGPLAAILAAIMLLLALLGGILGVVLGIAVLHSRRARGATYAIVGVVMGLATVLLLLFVAVVFVTAS